MHLVFIGEINLPGNSTGGIGTFLASLCPVLAAQGHRVSIISRGSGRTGIQEYQGYTVYWLHENNWPSPLKGIFYHWSTNETLRRLHALQAIDIIETQEIGMAMINRPPGARLVIRLHGGHHFFCHTIGQQVNRRTAWIENRSFAHCDAIIGVTQFVYDITRQYHNFTGKQTAIIPYPVNTDQFTPQGQPLAQPPQVFFAGSLVRKKGVFELIEAMATVQARHPQAQLYLYGRDTKDAAGNSCKNQLEALIAKLKLRHIHLMGAVDHGNLPELIGPAAVCVYPSHSETQGIVVLEAMSMGKAVIFGDAGPARETITHGHDGLLCNPHQPMEIAEQILRVLDDASYGEALGQAARQTVVNRFALPWVAQLNIDFYKKLKATGN